MASKREIISSFAALVAALSGTTAATAAPASVRLSAAETRDARIDRMIEAQNNREYPVHAPRSARKSHIPNDLLAGQNYEDMPATRADARATARFEAQRRERLLSAATRTTIEDGAINEIADIPATPRDAQVGFCLKSQPVPASATSYAGITKQIGRPRLRVNQRCGPGIIP